MPKAIIVKRYKTERVYQQDAGRMAKRGYKIVTVTSERPRHGCLTIITFGFFLLLFPPKPQYVVTYSL